ncbi:MAG: hypothetical protein ACREGI_04345, partial [Candidatus Levyibacteriota bacterium]
PLSTNYFGEIDTIWSAGEPKKFPVRQIEVISGNALTNDLQKKSTQQSFKINAKTNATFLDNTIYYLGWRVYVNGQEVPIEFQNQKWPGLITFSVPKGESSVIILFKETHLRLLADWVSLATIFLLFIGIFIKIPLQYNEKRIH